jgi:hypothetical protein
MRTGVITALVLCAALGCALPALAQYPRQDLIWARSVNGAPPTLDGVLNEAVWAQAESVKVLWGVDNGIPGSGYKSEGGFLPSDGTNVTVKILRDGNQIYMGMTAPDKSMGGGTDFNRFEGFLMGVKDRSLGEHPAPVAEYFVVWWDPDTLWPGGSAAGQQPNIFGRWRNYPDPRTPEQIAAWDVATKVYGTLNDDADVDTGYVMEMRMDAAIMGYDFSQPEGDIFEWNISVYDCDYFWPLSFTQFSTARAWLQDPWGNTSWFDEMRVWGRSDVTVSSGAVPVIEPELRVANAAPFAPPTIDGLLNEAVYASAPKVRIKYNDAALRETYGNPGKWRSGQFQPEVNGGLAPVTNPGDATVYYFFRDDSLYLGFDVTDRYVQYVSTFDRWDGFMVSLNERERRGPDKSLLGQKIAFQVGASGEVIPQDSLPFLISRGAARVALQLKPGTSVDTLAQGIDAGWTAELILDLTKFGYPPGRGDGLVFLGVDLLDGDSFTDFQLSYGTRTWWWREHDAKCCPPWGYMDPALLVVGVEDETPARRGFALLGNFPNPYRDGTVIRYSLPGAAAVVLELYDVRGRLLSRRSLGVQEAGMRQAELERSGASGLRFYRLRMADPKTGKELAALSGKMMVLE